MTGATCSRGLGVAELLDYWLGDLDDDRSTAFEAHLFECGPCTERLDRLASLGEGVKRVISVGGVAAVLTPAFVSRLKQSGLRVREYRLEPSSSVLCTIAPEDDLVVAHLRAPLEGVPRVDLVLHDPSSPSPLRMDDLPFDAGAGEILVASESAALRRLGTTTQRIELLARDGVTERVLGDYTFNHRPYRAGM